MIQSILRRYDFSLLDLTLFQDRDLFWEGIESLKGACGLVLGRMATERPIFFKQIRIEGLEIPQFARTYVQIGRYVTALDYYI